MFFWNTTKHRKYSKEIYKKYNHIFYICRKSIRYHYKTRYNIKNKEQYYVYSKTIQNQTWNNKEKYQLAATLEFNEPKALVVWNYQPVTYNYPSIILAATKASWVNNYFVIDWWKNLAYSLNWDNVLTKEEVSDITKKDLLKHVYKTCEEIKNSWEFIWNLEYQLYNSWRDYTACNCN